MNFFKKKQLIDFGFITDWETQKIEITAPLSVIEECQKRGEIDLVVRRNGRVLVEL